MYENGIQLYLYTKSSIDRIISAILAIDEHAMRMMQTSEPSNEIRVSEYAESDGKNLSYKCENCEREIPLAGEYCPFCHAKAPLVWYAEMILSQMKTL